MPRNTSNEHMLRRIENHSDDELSNTSASSNSNASQPDDGDSAGVNAGQKPVNAQLRAEEINDMAFGATRKSVQESNRPVRMDAQELRRSPAIVVVNIQGK